MFNIIIIYLKINELYYFFKKKQEELRVFKNNKKMQLSYYPNQFFSLIKLVGNSTLT